MELGCRGFQETEDQLLCYFEKGRWRSRTYPLFRKEIRKILGQYSVDAEVRFREIEGKNWNAEWERSLKPLSIGRRFTIQPSWIARTGGNGRITILIDPKMSFGTGYHESTRLILSLMESHMDPGVVMLDVGTGTGILAIAGIALGALSATATDIDEWALDNARENVRLNNVESRVVIADRSLSTFTVSAFGAVCANIMYTTIVEMLPDFFRILRPSGKLFLSGLLDTQRADMLAALERCRFGLVAESQEHEWIALVARKK